MSSRDDLRKLIADLAIVHGRVVLSSGREADYYVDLRRVTLHHAAAPLIGSVMLDTVADWDFDAVGGLTLGADPVATAMLHAAAGTWSGVGRVRSTQDRESARPAAPGRRTGRRRSPGSRGRGHLDDGRQRVDGGGGVAAGRRRRRGRRGYRRSRRRRCRSRRRFGVPISIFAGRPRPDGLKILSIRSGLYAGESMALVEG